ncbi:MAG TPA: nitronate monooxygenase [Bryobacteraceae bacterium]|nr:nitronate monooxygenase [Bryobacteraceae bacterium]
MLATPFTRLAGVTVPIMQAPIGSCCCPELAAAVSNAGGLGMLALSWNTPQGCERQIRSTQLLTAAPFGVNLVVEWDQMDRLRLCLDAGVKVVSLFWGAPDAYLPSIHSAGGVAIVQIGSVDEAKQAADAGADAVLCQGFEAGGHVRGRVGSLALIPSVVDAVSPLPVLAAGGFADGRGLAAALALGASAISMGTRFVASQESRAHPAYKQRLLEARAEDTVHTSLFDGGWEGAPHRVIRNSTVEEWERAGRPKRGHRPTEGAFIGRIKGKEIALYDDTPPLRDLEGEWERCPLYAGESVALVHELRPAAEIVREVAAEAERTIARLNQFCGAVERT